MERNSGRSSRKDVEQWEVQRVGNGTLRYLTATDGSTVVVARQSANAFCWEDPEGQAPKASNPDAESVSVEEALRGTLSFLRWAYRS